MASSTNGQQETLALPPAGAPELIQHYPDADTTFAALAVYTLVPGMTAARVEEIAAEIEAPWRRKSHGGDAQPDLRLARAPAGDDDGCRVASVAEAIAAHAALAKYGDEDEDEENLRFVDIAFLLVTKGDVSDPHALLLVYVDTTDDADDGSEDEDDDEPRYDLSGKLDKFFVDIRLAHFAISGFVLGDATFPESKARFDVDSATYDPAPFLESDAS